MTEAEKYKTILKDHNLKQDAMANRLKLKFSSFRVALTKDEVPKWLSHANFFYDLGKQRGQALEKEIVNGLFRTSVEENINK